MLKVIVSIVSLVPHATRAQHISEKNLDVETRRCASSRQELNSTNILEFLKKQYSSPYPSVTKKEIDDWLHTPACEPLPQRDQILSHFEWLKPIDKIVASHRSDEYRLDLLESEGKTILIFEGSIGVKGQSELLSKTLQLAKRNGKPMLLVLNSPGGMVEEGEKVIDLLVQFRDSGQAIHTFVPENGLCASFCTNLFPIGNTRVAAPHSHFMFHSVHWSGKRDGDWASGSMAYALNTNRTTQKLDLKVRANNPEINWNQIDQGRIGKAVKEGADCWETGASLFREGSKFVSELKP